MTVPDILRVAFVLVLVVMAVYALLRTELDS
jgi:hypothetical protein